jgi:hypothetical protein
MSKTLKTNDNLYDLADDGSDSREIGVKAGANTTSSNTQ